MPVLRRGQVGGAYVNVVLASMVLVVAISPSWASNAVVKSGKYTLTPQSAAAERLDATDKSTKNGTQIQLWKAAGNVNQKWILTDTGKGWFKIQPSYDPTLAVEVRGNSAKDGTPVVLWIDDGSTGQRWYLHAAKGGYS